MGERGVIQLKSKDLGSVCFYTHWRGYQMRQLALEVIKAQMRWDDHTYFASIMFRHLTGDYLKTSEADFYPHVRALPAIETSFGIWAGKPSKIGDENYPPVLINLDKRTIKQARHDDKPALSATFEQLAKSEV